MGARGAPDLSYLQVVFLSSFLEPHLQGHKGGLTNKEKQRKKNFVMVRKGKRSVANKIRKSNSDVRYDKMKHVRNHSSSPHYIQSLILMMLCNNRKSNLEGIAAREGELRGRRFFIVIINFLDDFPL